MFGFIINKVNICLVSFGLFEMYLCLCLVWFDVFELVFDF